MKNLSLILLMFCTFSSAFSQKDYTVNGTTYQLKTEVEGSIDLLWNVIDGNYRYFVEKDGEIEELTNTKNNSGSFQEEYLSTLKELTGNSDVNSKSVKLTLPSLRDFVNQFNVSADPNYVISQDKIELKSRLGLFAGITNMMAALYLMTLIVSWCLRNTYPRPCSDAQQIAEAVMRCSLQPRQPT